MMNRFLLLSLALLLSILASACSDGGASATVEVASTSGSGGGGGIGNGSASGGGSSTGGGGGGGAQPYKAFGIQPIVFPQGQSNATAYDWPEAAKYNGSDLLAWDGGAWVEARVDLGGEKPTGTGPWAGRLTRAIMAENDNAGVTGRVINMGALGKPIAYFLPNSPDITLYDGKSLDPQGRNNYTMSRDYWEDSGYEPNLICFVQGENDSGRSEAEYRADLETLIAAWKQDYPALEWIVIVQTPEKACGGDSSGVRAAQLAVANDNAGVLTVSMDPFINVTTYNGCHYLLPGYEIMADVIKAALDTAIDDAA